MSSRSAHSSLNRLLPKFSKFLPQEKINNEGGSIAQLLKTEVEKEKDEIMEEAQEFVPAMLQLGFGGTCVDNDITEWCTDQMKELGICKCINVNETKGALEDEETKEETTQVLCVC